MESYDALKLENHLCFPLYACAREVIKRYTPQLERLDLTYTQYIAMMALWEHGGLSVKALGRLLYLDSSTLTPLLKKLEAKGWVTRSRSERDARSVQVCLTPEDRALREAALPVPGRPGGLRLAGQWGGPAALCPAVQAAGRAGRWLTGHAVQAWAVFCDKSA